MREIKEITIKMEKIDGDQYFCKGKRLTFDLPWTIYRVNGDFYAPYYRVYIGERLMRMANSEKQCYEYIQNVSDGEAHIAEM